MESLAVNPSPWQADLVRSGTGRAGNSHPILMMNRSFQQPIQFQNAWNRIGYGSWLFALALCIYAYYPSHNIRLLVEHWEFNDSLRQMHFDPFKWKDWLTAAF